MLQLREGIDVLQKGGEDRKKAGLLVSEIQVVFNVTASATDSTKIGLDLAPTSIIPAVPKASVEAGSEKSESRSNQITIKFQNLFLVNKDTLVGITMTPITLTSGKTTEKDKITETDQTVSRAMTLEQLWNLMDQSIIMTK